MPKRDRTRKTQEEHRIEKDKELRAFLSPPPSSPQRDEEEVDISWLTPPAAVTDVTLGFCPSFSLSCVSLLVFALLATSTSAREISGSKSQTYDDSQLIEDLTGTPGCEFTADDDGLVTMSCDYAAEITDTKTAATTKKKKKKKKTSGSAFFSKPKVGAKLGFLIYNAPVMYYPEDIHTRLGVSETEFWKTYEPLTKRIKKLLPQAINHEVLETILDDPDFSFILCPEGGCGLPKGSEKIRAFFDPRINSVCIKWPEGISDERLLQHLRNELHHAAIYTKTHAEVEDPLDTQFLSPVYAKRLKHALKKGEKRIKVYKEALKEWQDGGRQSPLPKKIAKLFTATEEYYPHRPDNKTKVTKKHHEKLLDSPGVTVVKPGLLKIERGTGIFVGEPDDLGCHIRYRKDGEKYQYEITLFANEVELEPERKAEMLFADFKAAQDPKRDKYYKPSKTHFYLPAKMKPIEDSSDVEMLPMKSKKLFYPEWCELMEDFHGTPYGYCRLAAPK